MRPYLLICLTFFISVLSQTPSFSQSWLWAGNVESPALQKTDRLDNLVVVGNNVFVNTTTYMSHISKFDRFGNLIWKKTLLTQPYNVGGLFSGVRSHALDYDGNIYLLTTNVRQYEDSVFIVNDTVHNLVKLDADGNLIWRKKMTSQDYAQGSHIVSNGKYDLFLNFQSRANSYQLLDSIYNHPAPGNTSRLFTAKIDTAGRVKWTKICYGRANYLYSIPPSTTVNAANILQNRVSVNDNGYILIGGVFFDTLKVPGILLTAPPLPSLPQVRKSGFLLLLDSNGQRQWSKLIPLADASNFIPDVHLFRNRYGAYQLRNLFQNIPVPPSGSAIVYNDTLVFINSQGNKISQANLRPAASDHFEINDMEGKDYSIYITGRQYTAPIVNPFTDTTYMQLRRYDTSGVILWNKGLPAVQQFKSSTGTRISLASDFILTSGAINTAVNSQCVFDNDTINTVANSLTHFLAAVKDSVNIISGRVFIDVNNNGVYNTGIDRPAAFQVVRTTTGNTRAVTDSSGYYQLFIETGAVTISPLQVPSYYSSTPASHSFNFTNYGNNAPDKNFIYAASVTANDLEIIITPLSGASWSRPSYMQLNYKNTGTTTLNGAVRLKLDPKSFYISSSVAPSFTSSDSLSWSFSNLQPFESGSIVVTHRYLPQTVPTPVLIKSWIDPIAADFSPENNFDTANLIATGPYDPNDKLANPIDKLNKDSVAQNKAVIDYVIRFQNTGSDTAFQVKILDTLSSLLNAGSLQIVAASHYCKPVVKNNQLEIYFPDISLPDSNVNEPGSHGFIHFRIKPNATMTMTDTIFNRAAIYFDYNPAIITNWTKNYIPNPIITGVNDPVVYSKYLGLYPNPSRETVYYEIKNAPAGNYVLSVYDLNGRLVYRTAARSSSTGLRGNLPVSHLGSGTYVLEITGKNMLARKKLLRL
jgi:hypothetical protein